MGDDHGRGCNPLVCNGRRVDFDLMSKHPTSESSAALSAELQAAFGESVRSQRTKANMTQADLALRSGINQETISRIEKGRYNLTLLTMSRLATVLDGDVAKMLNSAIGDTDPT
jgi:DNA-binding XRE family transcriptional regulator